MPGFFIFSPERLRSTRERKGLSREQLAIAARSSYPALSLYENGHRSPNRSTLLRLSAALGVDPRELIDDDPAFTVGADR
jgi:transcriptional regulator with XRE-family HTH domain